MGRTLPALALAGLLAAGFAFAGENVTSTVRRLLFENANDCCSRAGMNAVEVSELLSGQRGAETYAKLVTAAAYSMKRMISPRPRIVGVL